MFKGINFRRIFYFLFIISTITVSFGLAIYMTLEPDIAPDDSDASTATTYYLDCNEGNDGNTGTTQATAWRTIEKINNSSLILQPGGKLLLKRGCTWTGQINARWNGTASAPIIIGAYGIGENPLIQANPNGVIRRSASAVNITGDYQIVENLRATLINPYQETRCNEDTGLGWYIGFNISGNNNIVRKNEAYGPLAGGISLTDNAQNNKALSNNIHDLTSLWQLWRNHSTDDSLKDDYYRTTPIGRNVLHPGGPIGAVGINLHGTNGEFAYNTFKNNKATCTLNVLDGDFKIYSAPFEVFHASNNYIHHNSAYGHKKHFEMGRWAPNADSPATANNVLAYNLFVSDLPNAKGPNIHGGDDFGPVENTKVYNNTIVFTGPNSEAIVASGPGTVVKNNILIADGRRRDNQETGTNEFKVAYSCNGTSTFSNNIFGRVGGGAKIQIGNSLSNCPNVTSANEPNSRMIDPSNTNTPLFEILNTADLNNSDFRIKTTSYAKNNGVNEILNLTLNNIKVSTDLHNGILSMEQTLDIGTLEYGAVPAIASTQNQKGVSYSPTGKWGISGTSETNGNWIGYETDLSDMKNAGIGWTRIGMSDLFLNNTTVNDKHADLLDEYGIQALLVTWAPDRVNSKPDYLTNVDHTNYLNRLTSQARALKERYPNRTLYYEIHNEPNLGIYWNIDGDPLSNQIEYEATVQRYVTYLREAGTAIKAGDPTAKVMNGGLSEYRAERWMDAFIKHEGYKHIDIYAFHPYGNSVTRVRNRLNAMMTKVNPIAEFAAKPIWITEVGFHSTSGWNSGMYIASEEDRGTELAATMQMLKEYPRVELPVFWYSFAENGAVTGYGLVTKQTSSPYQTTYHPAYYNYKELWVDTQEAQLSPTPVPTEAPTQPEVTKATINSITTQGCVDNVTFTVTWTNPSGGDAVSAIDISDDINFSNNNFYHKTGLSSVNSYTGPEGFVLRNTTTPFVPEGNKTYYVRAWNGIHSDQTADTQFTISACPTPNSTLTPVPSIVPATINNPVITGCIDGPTTDGSFVSISWTNSQTAVTSVEISSSQGFPNNNKYFKSPQGTTTVTGPSGFRLVNVLTPLTINPDTSYYIRVWNGEKSEQKTFSVPSCSTPTNTPIPTPLGYCGDGILQKVRGEQCDDGNDSNIDECLTNCRYKSVYIR